MFGRMLSVVAGVVLLCGVCLAQEAAAPVDRTNPLPVARAVVTSVIAGDVKGLLDLYHPESRNGQDLKRLEEQYKGHFDLLVEYLSRTTKTVCDALQVEPSFGEVTLEGDEALVPVAFRSRVQSDFTYEFTMRMKQAGLPDGTGTAWFVFEDGMDDFYVRAEEASADIDAQMDAMRQELNTRALALLEEQEKQDRAAALQSPAGSAALFVLYLVEANPQGAVRLLHPESELGKQARPLEAGNAEAFQVYARYMNRVASLVFQELKITPEFGEVSMAGETAVVPLKLKSETQPDLALETPVELRESTAGEAAGHGWHVWNGEAVLKLLLTAGGAQPDLAEQVKSIQDNYEERLQEVNVRGPFGRREVPIPENAATVDRSRPRDVASALLGFSSKGNIRYVNALFHPESDLSKRWTELGAEAGAQENALKISAAVYTTLFVSLELEWDAGDVTLTDTGVTVAVHVTSAVKPEIAVDETVALRQHAPEGGMQGWYVWETKLFDALEAAVGEHDAELAAKLKALEEEATGAETAQDEVEEKAEERNAEEAEAAEETEQAPDASEEKADGAE